MKKTKLFTAIALATSISLVSGCNSSGGSSSPSVSSVSLLGSVFKGPIDQATTTVMDETGKELASSNSTKGKFEIKNINLPTVDTEAVFIKTQGGRYTDEATGEMVTPVEGLMTVFTVADLKEIISRKQVIALTPDTTLMAKLVKKMIADGKPASEAIMAAKERIQKQFIAGTSPVAGMPGDEILLIGDLSAPVPADAKEALARNRAISFSYEAQTMNLSPSQVFELINKRALDLEDGMLDGKNGSSAILIADKNGVQKPLGKEQKTRYGLERTRLFNNTLARLNSGKLSGNEVQALENMGVNIDFFTQQNLNNQAAAEMTTTNLTKTNLPDFNHLPVLSDEDGNPNDNKATYTLTSDSNVNVTVNVPGDSWVTPMLRYNKSQLPPIIKANRGDQMTMTLVNNLKVDVNDPKKNESTIHWHGFKIPGDQDGGVDYPVAAGDSKTYSFPMLQPAASLWFHPHPDLKTGEQVYGGLVGVYLLDDAISKKLVTDNKLPSGQYDIPILVQDRRFKDKVNGVRELSYMDMEMDMDGMLGDKVLVNGAELPKLNVETRQYRFRLYNASNARTYDFALHDGSKFKVVGTDGGLLPKPVEVDHITLGSAERAEIIIDFANYTKGDKVMLISKGFSGSAMMGMPGGMNMGGNDMVSDDMANDDTANNDMASNDMASNDMASNDMASNDMGGGNMPGMLANGQRMDIMRFDITETVTDPVSLYTALPANADINTQRLTASDASKTRNFVMTMAMGNMSDDGMNDGGMGAMTFVINGKTFDMNRIDEVVNLSEGDTEIWSIQNRSPMAHPFHAHAIQWQILSRNGKPAKGIDLGWKDTVLVQPGETVNFIGRFDPVVNYGVYMYHCHILEHEDAGMMGFFKIQ